MYNVVYHNRKNWHKKDKYVLNLNNRKILNGILETVKIINNNDDHNLTELVLRSIDKIDRLGLQGVKDLLGVGRRDDSGDFTAGANLNKEQIDYIIEFITLQNDSNSKILAHLENLVGDSKVGIQGIDEVKPIFDLSEAAGFSEDRIRLNPGTVRGLGYYIGPVFEVELIEKLRMKMELLPKLVQLLEEEDMMIWLKDSSVKKYLLLVFH